MFISTGKDNVHFKTIEVKSLEDLAILICKDNYSLGTFTNEYRNLQNFITTKCIGLDFDNDKSDEQVTLEQAKDIFKNHTHIISTSRNHQKEKNGLTVDRFRVILFLDKECTSTKDFTQTWLHLDSKIKGLDPACKDASRFWYPSKEVVSINKGKKVVVQTYIQPETTEKQPNNNHKGRLSYETMQFFCQGAPKGTRHGRFFKAVVDCREQNYDKPYVIQMLTSMINNTGTWDTSELTHKELGEIDGVYKRELKHPTRLDKTYNFVKVDRPMNKDEMTVDWIVDNLLMVGGMSIMAGDPKSGKSTLLRQLCVSVARGNKWLERKTTKGAVCYLGIEEQYGTIRSQFKTQGMSNSDDVYIHSGSTPYKPEKLEEAINASNIKLLIIDPLADFFQLDDLNNHGTMNKHMRQVRDVARNTGCHIMFIHHVNKGDGSSMHRISGSNAMFGAVDCAILFEGIGKNRFISSSGRGIKFEHVFKQAKLQYNSDKELYALISK